MSVFFKSRFMLVHYVGRDIHAMPLPLWLIGFIMLLIPCMVTATGAFTIYQLRHDDVLNALLERHIVSDYIYEEKIALFRNQLDRLATHQLLDQNSLEGKVRDLMAREVVLENRASVIASLAEQVSLGPDITSSLGGKITPSTAQSNASAPNQTPSPQPAAANMREDKRPKKRVEPWMEQSSALEKPVSDIIKDLAAKFAKIETQQNENVRMVGDTARRTSETLRTTLSTAGLSMQRFMPTQLAQNQKNAHDAQGGPLVELATDPTGSQFERALHAMRTDIISAQYLLSNLPAIPLRRPLVKTLDQTSGFGMRIDPFTGRYAMHTGLDFRESIGAPVRSTAQGKIIFAGQSGGYGNMVEIDHGNGITTRYGHLQTILVREGERVSAGSFIGQVGSTGRSTGPHLHYEVRIDGDAVDPVRLLQSGARLYQG